MGAQGGGARSLPTLKSKGELKSQIVSLVKHSVKDRTGPSFDERLAAAVAVKNQQMRISEKEQWARIRECKEKGEVKSVSASPLAAMAAQGMPDKVIRTMRNQQLQARKEQMDAMAKDYARKKKAMMDKIQNREPLFKLSEVGKAQENLIAMAEKRKRDMRDEEKKRWEMLEEINRSVLARPLLMDS